MLGPSVSRVLRDAADLIESRAAAATPPQPVRYDKALRWRVDSVQSIEKGCRCLSCWETWGYGVDAVDGPEGPDGCIHPIHVNEPDAEWIAMVGPQIAAPLAAWLRNHADYCDAVPVTPQADALALARAIVGEQP